jgi:hypothetical protein
LLIDEQANWISEIVDDNQEKVAKSRKSC